MSSSTSSSAATANFSPAPASSLPAGDIDTQFLSLLFPSLAVKKPSDLKRLACLRAFGDAGRPLSAAEVSKISKVATPAATAKKMLGSLATLSLLSEEKTAAKEGGKEAAIYRLTSKGVVALMMSMAPFREFSRVRPLLASLKNDELAFALLVVGHSPSPFAASQAGGSNNNNNDGQLHAILAAYAKYGHSLEAVDGATAADSLLRYFSSQFRAGPARSAPPSYLGMFRDFTPAGFQDILKMLVVAVRPTPEDYNWLVQFFYELVEFYYNPVRMAYASMLVSNPVLKSRLEGFKKGQEIVMKKDGDAAPSVELTFRIAGGLQLDKFLNMPPHLKAMAFKLVLEPLRFMNEELRFAFWGEHEQSPDNNII